MQTPSAGQYSHAIPIMANFCLNEAVLCEKSCNDGANTVSGLTEHRIETYA